MEPIDFVITWVDGADERWQKERKQYLGLEEKLIDDGDSRYRDWDLLRYWFRGVEKYTPWVNKIYFVTWGHVPQWLNTSHPKLVIVNHKDYIPEEYLPTFSSHPIELNLHRIEGLSQHFVYFNDDMFVIRDMKREDFFKKGLPRDTSIETALAQDDINNPFPHILLNNTAIINERFSKKRIIAKNFGKWFHPCYGKFLIYNILLFPFRQFSGIKYTHQPSAFLKSTFEEVWEEEYDVLHRVCQNRFRSPEDVNQYIMKYWQYMNGAYVPQSPKIGRFYTVGKDDECIVETICKQKCKMICINDNTKLDASTGQQKMFVEAFETILGQVSSFEKA